jgi:CRP-like cAMP-binding protein
MRLRLLAGTKLATLLPSAVLEDVSLRMEDVLVPPGELLLLEGDLQSESMYIVVEGQFEILASEGNADAQAEALVDYGTWGPPPVGHPQPRPPLVVATVGPGAALGEVSFFLKRAQRVPRQTSVRASIRSYVLRLERHNLDTLLARRGLDFGAPRSRFT